MGTGVGDVGTDVPMLVIDQQPTVGGRRVLTDWTASCQPLSSVPSPRRSSTERYDSKTGIEIPREKELDCRNAELKESMNHHVFDEIPGSEAVGKKLIRARWLIDDRGEKARESLVKMEIEAFEGNVTTTTR